jgi:predicted unusual protein kinase regulating ubiquinone biosynthesis (AarF/ABC1/UbiB family)
MYSAADNIQQTLKLEAKRRLLGKSGTLKDQTQGIFADPIKALFKDLSTVQLLGSWWRILLRIYKLQGFKAALRVFPIVWMIVKTVGCFSRYHADEYARMKTASDSNQDLEETVLTEPQYEKYRSMGKWLCQQLHDLGPTFIKIGQTLSTRADLLPLPAMLELAVLQEQVTQFPTEIALATIERELGGTPETLYASFNKEPIAAASLSQAYRATLHDGREVVVKVQRPNLPQLIARDVQVLAAVADEVMKYPSLCRHTDWPGVVEEFARTIFEEIDYIKEGRNADTFRHNFRNFDRICIPRIVWRLTGRRVLTIEYVEGSRINDLAAMEEQNLDRDEITRTGVNFYLRQLLEDGFFHADPHPGNMRIMAGGRFGIFDFGMVGRISEQLKQHMINAFLHVVQGDYRALIDDFVGMNILDASVDREALFEDLSPIIDARFAEGMNNVRFRKMLFDFSDVCYRYPFRLPSEFTYIMRALLTLEGVALTINPDFNFIEAAMPFAHRIVLKNNGVLGQALLKEVFTDGRFNPGAAINLFKAAAKLTAHLN